MEPWPLKDRFWRRWTSARGRAVLINGSTVTISSGITEDEMAEADYAYVGGHVYTVDNATAAVLTSLGFATKTQAEADALSDEAHDGFLVAL
jgi:hypothetical protein